MSSSNHNNMIFSKTVSWRQQQPPPGEGGSSTGTYENPLIPNDEPTPVFQADWRETARSHIFRIATPGFTSFDDITIAKWNVPETNTGMVSISGTRPPPPPVQAGAVYIIQQIRGGPSQFNRVFHVGGRIDEGAEPSARLERGVLTVEIMKEM